ncbi:olfactory receptor 6B9-like [Rhinoderma darwinii]|uniref:olfactory receptor 6B9-like n=1 Tax=Rhinoderma darwinii TaxID=43563 RepID=UPI003F681ACA
MNVTEGVSNFFLLGFPTNRPIQVLLFFIFFLSYLLTILENLIVIVIIWHSQKLHKPMYFFLGQLSFLEMWYVTVTVPKLLAIFLSESRKISFTACMLQLYFFLSLGCTECVLLTVMAFDRYVAICNPLHYINTMNWNFCYLLAFVSWGGGFVISLIKVYYISRLTFCYPALVNHFYCDISPILNLACTDMRMAEFVDFILALLILLIPLLLTIISYGCILTTIINIPTSSGRKKAFSTCTSHLVVVVIFYSTTLFMYARPSRAESLSYNKLVSVIYTVVTPLLNPIIYCLRNKEVKETIWKSLSGGCVPAQCDTLSKSDILEGFITSVKKDTHLLRTKLDSQGEHLVHPNLIRDEMIALQELVHNDDLVIKPTNKGGVIVIMDRLMNVGELKRQLNDSEVYKKVNGDPKFNSIRRLKVFIDKAYATDLIVTPIIYCLPKIHEDMKFPPGRPIVSRRYSLLSPSAVFLDKLLRNLAMEAKSYIKDTTDFFV